MLLYALKVSGENGTGIDPGLYFAEVGNQFTCGRLKDV